MIKISITGEQATGKSLLLRRIKRLLHDELNVEMAIDDDRTDGAHFGMVSFSDENRATLATLPHSLPDQLRAVARFSAHPVAVCQMAEDLADAMEDPASAKAVELTRAATPETMTSREATARELAAIVLNVFDGATIKSLHAIELARLVLGHPGAVPSATLPIFTVTNGTERMIPCDEPVFLLRAQDENAADTVHDWACRAEANGASPEIVESARAHARLMEAYPLKKTPDLPK